MTNWKEIKCYECKNCNRKGKPSISKGSAHCRAHRGILSNEDITIWTWIKTNIFLKEIKKSGNR